ncbi:MAG: FmdB family zinc ribbon protein [Anaerolineae bacterium]
MPLYTYRCKECEHEFDIRQSFSEDSLTDCPNCEKAALRKVINQVGVVFRGSGFYVNDSKSNNSAAPGGTSKSDNGGSDSKEASASSSSDSGGSGSESKSTESSKPAKSEAKSTAKAAKSD